MLAAIIDLIQTKQPEISTWFDQQWEDLTPPLYLSCDIRHSGHKIGVVDTNLFPAGFNNLCNAFLKQTAAQFDDYLNHYYPGAHRVLLLAEAHTRNKFYLENIRCLAQLLSQKGREVRVAITGSLIEANHLSIPLEGGTLLLERLQRNGNRIGIERFDPDLVVSNNDFSSGIPESLNHGAQPIVPSPQLGWHSRRKFHHFRILNNLIDNFARHFLIDPWLLHPTTVSMDNLVIGEKSSLDRLASAVAEVLAQTREKYDEYGIQDDPYIYLKNSAGTYGMGLIHLNHEDEVYSLNRRQRNKLLSSKGDQPSRDFIVQEGIPTQDLYSGFPIEPVLYAVGRNPIGGFFRIHQSRDNRESLNAPGMTFSCLCLHKLDEPHEEYFLRCSEKESVVQLSHLLTKMACLAAALEEKTL